MIDEIIIKTNVGVLNKHHERAYRVKKGVMIIKFAKGKTYILDLESDTDITDADYLEIVEDNKTKTKVLFKNIMFNKERLKRLAGGK